LFRLLEHFREMTHEEKENKSNFIGCPKFLIAEQPEWSQELDWICGL
jgi:hypothetical protein